LSAWRLEPEIIFLFTVFPGVVFFTTFQSALEATKGAAEIKISSGGSFSSCSGAVNQIFLSQLLLLKKV